MASTHNEIYRRFDGRLRRRALRFVPICLADVRVASKRKFPLVLLYAPPAITGIVFSFLVYARFTATDQMGAGGTAGASPAQLLALTMAQRMIQVHEQIVQAGSVLRSFALLVIAWFGAGLIAEDRRAGAHLLYFSRPLTRLDYFLGHYCTVLFFGLCAVLAPGLLICAVAVFSSPDWSFLKQEWSVILATVGYALVYVGTLSAFVLAISSLVPRKIFALAVVFGAVFLSQAVATVLVQLEGSRNYLMLGLWPNFERLGAWMLGSQRSRLPWDPGWSALIVGALFALSLLVSALRIRRLEALA